MAEFPFYFFAFLTVLAAAGVVVNRNVINSALCLLLSFVGVAALFVLLEAYFLAVLQVLIYVGAVAVLFLFVIMLFDVKGGDPRKPYKKVAAVSALLALALLTTGVLSIAKHGQLASPDLATVPAGGAVLKNFGYQLFTTYLLPVEVTGFLLLIAMLGVVVISKKFDADEGGSNQKSEGRGQEVGIPVQSASAGSQDAGGKA
jgi:NADH-quinone oxidoreductase subunit J